MEQKTINGLVQEKTNNSIKVNKLWIRFFESELLNEVNVNDDVKLTYTINQKNGKTYHNGKSIEVLTKPNHVESDIMANEQIIPKYISDTTINTLVMSVKDITIKYMEISTEYEDLELVINKITEDILNSYKKIKSSL